MELSTYPIDAVTLNKGDYIPPDNLSRIIGAEVGTAAYNFGMLKIKDYVERSRPDLVLKSDHDGLRILTDAEATVYADNEAAKGFTYAARSLSRLTRVDPSLLSEEEKTLHDRRLYVRSKQVQSVAVTGKQATVEWKPNLPWRTG